MNLYQIELNDNKAESFTYPAGETQARFSPEEIEKITAADTVHVTARITSAQDIVKLLLLTDAIQKIDRFAQKEYILILPYLPYSRADRRFAEGDCFGLKVFGNLINGMMYHKVVTFDVHSDKARLYINNLINVAPFSLVNDVLGTLPADTIILFPDEGAAKRYGKVFKNVMFCHKKRDGLTGKLLGFEVPKEIYTRTDSVLIVDDLCDGGGTFLGIAKELPNMNLYLYVSHGIFSKGLTDLSQHFLKIYTTDSFKSVVENDPFDIRVVFPIGGLIKKELIPMSEVWKTACQSS